MSIAQPATPIVLYRHVLSGHAHRIELFLSLLGLPYSLVNVDLANGAHKQPEFLAKNVYGQIPVIEDGEITLADSNAILVYLATRYGEETWLPRDALGAAAVQRFLSIAAGDIAFGPATARLINVFGAKLDHEAAKARANRVLTILNELLHKGAYLVGSTPTIADVACYTYIAHAPEGGVSLEPYPNVISWIKGIEALPGFVPMKTSPVGLLA